MASVWTAAAGGAATGGRPRAGWGDDLAAALLGTWVVAGLFMDGWAHVNQPGLETFFSPWHAIFYAGFLVSVGGRAGPPGPRHSCRPAPRRRPCCPPCGRPP